MSTSDNEITLSALHGSSLLGFMAALGAFRTLANLSEFTGLQMRWNAGGSSYFPVLRFLSPAEPEVLLERLDIALRAFAGHRVFTIDKDLKISCARFRELARVSADAFLSKEKAPAADMVAAFGCDAVGNEDGTIADTAFRTMSGAGHQHFLEFMDVLARETTVGHLREALFGPWRYRDPSPLMRWDSEDDRRYALRWDEPSKDPARTVRGANRLAIAALPFFPVVPISGGSIATTGFQGRGSRDTYITWPLWSGWLTLDAVSSLLTLRELQADDSSLSVLPSRGICAVYRAQRITLGKYRNFTPAKQL